MSAAGSGAALLSALAASAADLGARPASGASAARPRFAPNARGALALLGVSEGNEEGAAAPHAEPPCAGALAGTPAGALPSGAPGSSMACRGGRAARLSLSSGGVADM